MKPFMQTALVTGALLATTTLAHATTVMVYTDQAAFEADLALVATASTLEFDSTGLNPSKDDEVKFAANSTGNQISTPNDAVGTPSVTLDLIGGNSDPDTGFTGTGFLRGEVDSKGNAPDDGLQLRFNTGSILGFGLVGLREDEEDSTGGDAPDSLDYEELAIAFGDEVFLVSNLLGLTNPADFPELPSVINGVEGGPIFLGFIADVAQDGFSIVHGDVQVGPQFDVSGDKEEFYLDALIIGSGGVIPDPDPDPNEPDVVPLPAGLPLLLAGLGGLAVLRRKTFKA